MTRDQETTTPTAPNVPTTAPDDEDERALDQRITAYLKVGVPIGTIAGAVAAGFAQGAPAAVLVLSAGALVSAIAVFWSSIRTLVGETPLSGADAYALGAPRAEEEQKRAVLRALKDLEFERGVGKISEEDYQALVTKYRAEAKRLLRVLDESSQQERVKVEALVQKRLRREGIAAEASTDAKAEPKPEVAKAEPKPKGEAKPEAEEKRAAAKPKAKAACVECGTKNDADAVFCKKCGARQGPVVGDEDEEQTAKEPGNEEASS